MKIKIRQEKTADYKTVFFLIEKAFENEATSEHTEQILVSNLRRSNSFNKKLSLVAEVNNEIVGHILLSEVEIKDKKNSTKSLVLSPVSVLPYHQKKGVGKELIEAAHEIAKEIGYKSAVLIGDAAYFSKFGYKPAEEFNIQLGNKKNATENCLATELVKNGLQDVKGKVEYPLAFS